MARQNYFVNTTEKQLDIQISYAGGMVSDAHPEKLRDDQSIILENVNVVEGGAVKVRGAYSQIHAPSTPLSGNVQGHWKYNNLAGGQDIVAINGRLYTVINDQYTQVPIEGLSSFQSVRPIEAVQDSKNMWFATGSGLVKYDGSTAILVEAYAPTGLEALYIGTNGYADAPDSYLSDTTGAANVILGVVPDQRYGVMNENVTFTAFIQKVEADELEYQFEVKGVVDAEYATFRSWHEDKIGITNFGAKGDYMVRVSMRVKQTDPEDEPPILSQYVLPRFKVNTTPNEKPEPEINFEDMRLCNRIFLWYDRIFLYGDTGNPDHLYCSHLNKFDYYPRTNIIRVTDPKRGGLQAVQPYKNFLVCFTDGSIQGITGRNPQEFQKQPIHTTLGTRFPYSVQVMKNYISFVGDDFGTYVLKSFNYSSDDKMNVERIDNSVDNVLRKLLQSSTNVLSTIHDNQYYLYIEGIDTSYVYRLYYERGIWVRDNIGDITFQSMWVYKNTLYATAPKGGIIYELKDGVYRDGVSNPFNIFIESKAYDFGLPHHRKKLKQYQILAKLNPSTVIMVDVYADNSLLSSTALTYDNIQNTDAQKLKIMASGRFRYVKTKVDIPINGEVELLGFGFVYKLNTPK
jgi:hypothetical protein